MIGPQCDIVTRVGEAGGIKFDAHFGGFYFGCCGHQLHQPFGARCRGGLRVESTFLTGDRINKGLFDWGFAQSLLRNAKERKSMLAERQAALGGNFGNRQRGRGISVSGG